MNDIENAYAALHEFASSMRVEYVHRFRYYKECQWYEFYVKSIAGCEGTTELREKVSGIILSCQSKACDVLRSVEPSSRIALLSQWKEEVHELKYMSSEDKIEYDESEFGPASGTLHMPADRQQRRKSGGDCTSIDLDKIDTSYRSLCFRVGQPNG